MLIVEDGTIVEDAESYVSVADCDSYHTKRENSAWKGTAEQKEAALRKATSFIDNKYANRWKGARTRLGQALLWPRSNVLQFEEERQSGYAQTPVYIESNLIPRCLKDAVCEAALRALASDLAPDLERGGAVLSQTVGPITTVYSERASANTSYQVIDQLLSTLIKGKNTITLQRS